MRYSNVTVIIPTLNEAKNIGELVRVIYNSYKGMKIIVSDDGSSDGTQEIVRKVSQKNVKLLDRSSERVHGITASVIDAVKRINTEFFVVIDGDLQHPPEKIGEIVAKFRDGNELVIGTRKKVIGKWPWHRRLISKTATSLATFRLRYKVQDPMSGFFGMRTELFRKTLDAKEGKFEKEGYKVLFDLLKYVRAVKIAEIYYDFGERKGGDSKIRIKHILILAKALVKG